MNDVESVIARGARIDRSVWPTNGAARLESAIVVAMNKGWSGPGCDAVGYAQGFAVHEPGLWGYQEEHGIDDVLLCSFKR